MKKIIIVALYVTVMVFNVNAQDRPADDEKIKQTLNRFQNSWAKGDFSDMKEYMTSDCHWINVVGMHWHNLKEVQYAHQSFVSTMFKGVKARIVETTIRYVTKDVAIVYWTTHVDAFFSPDGVDRGNNKRGDTDDLATIVLIKDKGMWMIASAQNATVVAQAAASNPVNQMVK